MSRSMASPWTTCFLSFLWISLCSATSNSSDTSYDYDPIVQFRPNFARSLPVQILLTGVVFTLVAVLFIHLLFTSKYHWPLAQVNFILQMSGVTTLLISLIATLHVVLAASIRESYEWPYMLSYLGVDIPPLAQGQDADDLGWTSIEIATWLVMNATTSGLIQITHIHFLTLLFPSQLEARLIYTLLGPLAVLSAIMQLITLQGDERVVSYSDAVVNICNATLSLLFTAALFIWGFLVNRKQAWRFDGGTAIFGAGATFLALASTALTFVYIPSQDQYEWMPVLMWAVYLWQNFLGWWWWVGAGMGVGEVEELLKRQEKREKRRKIRRARRKEQKEKAERVWQGMKGAFSGNRKSETEEDSGSDAQEPTIQNVTPAQARDALNPKPDPIPSSASITTSRSWNTRPGRFFYKWWNTLRLAHLHAARDQAVERVERAREAYGEERDAAASQSRTGWGLGSYGANRVGRVGRDGESEEEEEPRSNETNAGQRHMRNGSAVSDAARIQAAIEEEKRTKSMWWWGPLRRWRLQDRTTYPT